MEIIYPSLKPTFDNKFILDDHLSYIDFVDVKKIY